MRQPFHFLAGLAGAFIFGATAGLRPFIFPATVEAVAIAAVNGADSRATLDVARAEATTEAVLRRAALRPEAAAIIARAAGPHALDRIAALVSGDPALDDPLGRAVALLGGSVSAQPGPSADTIRIVARMASPSDAATVATAVATAFVSDFNDVTARLDRADDRGRRLRLVAAARRREEARDRLAALRASDPTPTATIADAGAAAESDVAALERAAAAAETRLLEAAQVYGPRHPNLIQIETQARLARAALAAARARSKRRDGGAAPTAPIDPRSAAIAAAERDSAAADADYERIAGAGDAPRREARLVSPAPVPPAEPQMSATALIVGSAAIGFLFAGAAPMLARRREADPAPDGLPILGILKDGALGAADGRRVVEALDVAESAGARRVLIAGSTIEASMRGARATALAAMEAGWRPLLVSDEAPQAWTAPRLTGVRIDDDEFAVELRASGHGPLPVALMGACVGREPADVDLAYDLVIFTPEARIAGAEAILVVGDAADAADGLRSDDPRCVGAIHLAAPAVGAEDA